MKDYRLIIKPAAKRDVDSLHDYLADKFGEDAASKQVLPITNEFISEKRNDLTATEYRFGKAN